MVDIAERLALIIDAKTGGAVTELQKTAKSVESLAVQQDRAAASAAKMTAAQDKLSVSLAKGQVAEAKAAGDTEALAAAQGQLASATETANLSKAQAAIASDRLALSELAARDATAALGTSAVGAGGMLEKLGLSGLSAGGMLAKVGPLLGFAFAAATVKFLTDGVRHFEELTGKVRTFEAVTGASATQASLLVGQLKQLGVDPDTAAKAFARFGAAIGDGSTKLGDFGIQVDRNKDGTTNLVGTFENLRAAYQHSTDAATRDAIAKQLGLRQTVALIPLLKLTKEQIEDLNQATKASGGIVSDEDVRNARELKIAGNDLKESFSNLEMSVSKDFVPGLADGARVLTDIVDGIGLVKKGLIDLPQSIGEKIHNAIPFIGDKGGPSAAEKKADADLAVEALAKEQEAEDKLTQSLTGELSARRAVRDGVLNLKDARLAEADAQDKLNVLLATGAVNAKDVANAQKDLAAASRSVQRAQESEADAQRELNKARERASVLDLAEANNKLALAGDRIGGAKASEQQAQEKLDALLGSGNATAGQVAAAEAELKTRHDEVTQSVLDQSEAAENLTKVKEKGTAADPAVVAAERRVRDAHDSVRDAMDNQRDALDKLHEAEAGDPNYARKVADARRDLARAHNGVKDAMDNQVTASLGLKDATAKMNAELDGTATTLDAVIQKFKDLKTEGLNVDQILGLLGVTSTGVGTWGFPSSSTLSLSGHRAKGGPLEPFGAYLVAEPGTGGEIIQMGDSGGYATPVGQRGTVVHSHLHVSGLVTHAAVQEIARENAWQIRTTVLPRIE